MEKIYILMLRILTAQELFLNQEITLKTMNMKELKTI